ncbi:hypothetical protein [Stenotrophomonas maltophilia]|uniref:hypothetical protein n=1 Tax=Stenotrophomonas maltophilia TaxID=40324 RepID=UPI0013D9BE1A|nr:hypothetical protein [Stenotrophomonas maltophilia]
MTTATVVIPRTTFLRLINAAWAARSVADNANERALSTDLQDACNAARGAVNAADTGQSWRAPYERDAENDEA